MAVPRDLSTVRDEIDRIDRELVKLLAQRGKCVSEVMEFKMRASEVVVPQRVNDVMANVTSAAALYQMDTDFVAEVFDVIIKYFTGYQIAEFVRRSRS